MTLARQISMNAPTTLENRSAKAANINVAVAASFTKTQGIIAAFKRERSSGRTARGRKRTVLERDRAIPAVPGASHGQRGEAT